MDIEGEDGSRIGLETGSSSTAFGRALGFNTEDRTVSRRHILLKPNNQTGPSRVSFRVVGKNPVWVRRRGGESIEVYKKSEAGEVAVGDRLCISIRSPVWFEIKKRSELDGGRGSEVGSCRNLDSLDVSTIDPVKEFGFLVIGQEFDCYPKQRIRDVKDWDWFLEEHEEDGEDAEEEDESSRSKKRSEVGKRKRKKVGGKEEEEEEEDDEGWTGESEEDKEVAARMRKFGRTQYGTRSKDRDKPHNDVKRKKISDKRKNISLKEEDDDTLGGFIVDEYDEEGEEGSNEDEEEEEEEEEFTDEDELDD